MKSALQNCSSFDSNFQSVDTSPGLHRIRLFIFLPSAALWPASRFYPQPHEFNQNTFIRFLSGPVLILSCLLGLGHFLDSLLHDFRLKFSIRFSTPPCVCAPLTLFPSFYYLVSIWWYVQFCRSNTFVMFKYIPRDLILSLGRNTICHTYIILQVLYTLNRLPKIGRVNGSILHYLAIFPRCQDEERTFFIVDVCRRT